MTNNLSSMIVGTLIMLSFAGCKDNGEFPDQPTDSMALTDRRGPALEYRIDTSIGCQELCVSIDEMSYQLGKPIRGDISWNNLPNDTVILISLERTDDRRQEIMNSQPQPRSPGFNRHGNRFDGSLLLNPIPVTTSGHMKFEWSGDGFGCYRRSELPEICDGKAVNGEHVVSVKFVHKAAVNLPPPDPNVLPYIDHPRPFNVEVKSEPFLIE